MLKKIKQKIDKKLVLSFFIPFLILILGSICLNLLFDDKIVFVSDMKSQYSAFLSYYKDMVKSLPSISSFFYSFSKSIGSNMIGTVSYYLLSPFNFLLLFFSEKHLIYGMWLLVTLKISLSGLTMYLFLKDEFKTKQWYLILFSTSYALMGYTINYYFNLMWLDAVCIMPLILIGINKIVKNQGSLFYVIFLFLTILSNYYMGYIICLFCLLYVLYKIIGNYNWKDDRELILRIIIKFSIISFIVGLMTSIIIIPTISDLSNVGRNDMFILKENSNFLNPFPVISKLFIGSQDYENVLNPTQPHIYVGMMMLPLMFFYFFSKNIKNKDKILDIIFLSILGLGFVIPHINIIWHGFVEPNGFNYRYSFLFAFFMIYIGCKAFKNVKDILVVKCELYCIIFSILSLLVYFQNYSYLNYQKIIISLGCTIIYITLLYCLNNKKYIDKNKLVKKLLVILVFSELFFNLYISLKDYPFFYKKEYYGYSDTITKQIKKYTPNSNQFYRLEKDLLYSYMDGMLYNYSGVTIFDSTLNNKMKKFFNNNGFEVLERSIKYRGNTTEIIDALLGIRYLFLRFAEKENYNIVDKFAFSRYDGLFFDMSEKDILVYENPYALSLGYMVNTNAQNFVKTVIESKTINNLEIQNIMFRTMLNNNLNYLEQININKKGNNVFEIEIPKGKDFYLNILFSTLRSDEYVNVKINNQIIYQYTNKTSGIVLVNNIYNTDTVTLEVETVGSGIETYEPFAYYLNKDNFESAITELKKNQLAIEKMDNNYVKGSIEVTEDKSVMMTTIPYEKGWEILVDGEKVNYYSVFDAFIGIDLTEGNHTIEMTFTPPGLKLGALISLITLILFIIYIRFEKKIIAFIFSIYNKFEEVINYLIVGVLTTFLSIAIYFVFARIFKIDYYTSTVISWFISVLFAYITNKIFVFKSDIKEKKALIKETYEFYKYRLLSLIIEMVIMFLLIELLTIDDMVSKIITQVIVIIINYVFSKIFVFKEIH